MAFTPIDDQFCMVDFEKDIRIIQGHINLVRCTVTTVANRVGLVKADEQNIAWEIKPNAQINGNS